MADRSTFWRCTRHAARVHGSQAACKSARLGARSSRCAQHFPDGFPWIERQVNLTLPICENKSEFPGLTQHLLLGMRRLRGCLPRQRAPRAPARRRCRRPARAWRCTWSSTAAPWHSTRGTCTSCWRSTSPSRLSEAGRGASARRSSRARRCTRAGGRTSIVSGLLRRAASWKFIGGRWVGMKCPLLLPVAVGRAGAPVR